MIETMLTVEKTKHCYEFEWTVVTVTQAMQCSVIPY